MLAAKRSAGVAPELNLGECVMRTPPLAVHSGFETRRKRHKKWPHQKDLYPHFFF